MMDHHNYDTPPLLTNSDYETLMEDLKPDTNFSDIGSPFRLSQIDQNMSDEDPLLKQELQHPPPPLLEQFGPVAVQVRRESESILVTSTTPPELSPSLSPTGTIPSRDDYPGQLEFEIQLDSTTSSKRSWLYSTTLKKVFIDMRKSLLIHFRVNNYLNGLFVRALPVYEQDNFVSVPVQRCGIHQIGDDPHFKAHPPSEPGVCYCARHFMVKHVVQSTHPQARYDYNSESDRHSVVIPLQLPHPGSDTTTVEYQFACKTSCPHGMNRKPIVVIFTLENEACEVLGRQILPVKICSCPKRDKEKEEKEREEREKNAILNGVELPKPGKRRLSSHEKQEAKRVKTENTRQHEAMGTGNQTQEEGSRTDSFEKRILEQFVALEGRIGQTVANLQGAMEGRIGQTIANLQGAMEGRIAAMEGRIAAMEGRITAMEGRIGQTVANFQAKVDQLLGLVQQI